MTQYRHCSGCEIPNSDKRKLTITEMEDLTNGSNEENETQR